VASTPVAELDLPFVDLFAAGFDDDPHRVLREAREQHWLAESPLAYLVLTYEATHAVLRDKRFRFATEVGLDEGGEAGAVMLARAKRNLLNLTGEPHMRLRRLVTRAFTPRAAERLRPSARAAIDRLLDPVAPRGRCELVAEVTESFPIMVVCELLGAPPEDWPRFSKWAERLFRRLNFNLDEDLARDIVTAQTELDDYLRDLIEQKRSRPSDDLIGDLIRAEEEGDRLTTEDIVVLADNVLSAGTDTTRNELATAVHLLATHPDQRARLEADPGLIGAAVDEVMRLLPVVAGTLRHAMEDVELDGVRFPEGTVLGPTMAAANRDPAVYPDPDRFDITREHAAPPLSFGGGPHYCLGANLARVELEESMLAVVGRLKDLRPDGEVTWKSIVGIGGPVRLPIAFTPEETT
jgi:cytochrome P450